MSESTVAPADAKPADAQQSTLTTELNNFLAIKTEIDAIAAKYGSLTIKGIDDKFGIESVSAARKLVKKKRTEVQKRGKDLRDDAVKTQKAVIAAEKQIIELLQPVEDHLTAEEDRIENLKAEILREEARKSEEKFQIRVAEVCKLNITPNLAALRNISDEDFADYLEIQKAEFEKRQEAERVAAEARRIEDEKRQREIAELQAERDRLEAIRKQQEEEAAKITAEKKRLADAEDAKVQVQESKIQAIPEIVVQSSPSRSVLQNPLPSPAVIVSKPQSVPPAPAYPAPAARTVQQSAPASPAPVLWDSNQLAIFATRIKNANPPACPDELKAEIRKILLECGNKIEEAVGKYQTPTKQNTDRFTMDDF